MLIEDVQAKTKEYKAKEKEIQNINKKIEKLKEKRIEYWTKIEKEYEEKYSSIVKTNQNNIFASYAQTCEMITIQINIAWDEIIDARTQTALLNAFSHGKSKQSKWKPEKQKIYTMAKLELNKYLEKLKPLEEDLKAATQEKDQIRKELLSIWKTCESVLKLYSNLEEELEEEKRYASSLIRVKRNKDDAFYDPFED